ncbi:MAG: ABC transporter ATP-binding protein [Verrucomicrobia bacterium]|nr:ABC transporter ATP-binding protein [Verrucomicrobiota bacterium]
MTHHQSVRSAPDPSFRARSRSTWEVLRRVCRYLIPYKSLATATILCALLSMGASLAFPKLLQWVIDGVIARGRAGLLPAAVLGLLGAFLLRDLFNSLRILLNNTLEQNVIYDMRREVFARLQRLPVDYFDQRASGDLMTRVIEDVNSLERALIDGTEQGSVAVLGVIGVAIIMFVTDPLLGCMALLPLPLLAGGALWYTLTAHRRYRAQREASSAMNTLLLDDLQGVRQIKAFGREPHEDSRFASRAADLRTGTLGIMRAWAVYSPAMAFTGSIGMACVLWVGGGKVINGSLSVGELVGFLFYLGLFYEPIGRLHALNQMLQSARAAGERVFDILDFPVEPDSIGESSLKLPVRGDVVFENVSFEYQAGSSTLDQISFRAAPGEIFALVGPTGAGKSTILNLLPRFYSHKSGSIRLDGHETSTLPLHVLRSQISVVSQESFLFNGTIRENILFGRLEATETELLEAARSANCHEFISRLPNGYDSRVGERGVKLSVGEKQRVTIARALLKNAPILILDEATASVDTATEKLIQEALEHLMANRTSFVIAHRLSTIRRATQILVIQQGRILERGSHEQLIASNGLYSRLSRIQDASSIEEGFKKLDMSAP